VNWYKNIKDLLLLALLTLVIVLQGCEPRTPRQAAEGGSKLSVSLADAVMSRNDSLAIYNNPPSIRWQYDIAMLGQAIESLPTLTQVSSSAGLGIKMQRDGSFEYFKPATNR